MGENSNFPREVDDKPGGISAEHFLGDVALWQLLLNLSQRQLFQLGNVVLQIMSFPVSMAHRVNNHLVGKPVDRFG